MAVKVTTVYTLRSLNLYKEEFEAESEDFYVAYTFKRPFEREINAIWQKDIGEES